MRKRSILVGVATLGILGGLGASPALASSGASTNTSGSGAVNPSNYYNSGVTATWSQTAVSNGGWNQIVNATIKTTGAYGWQQTYTLAEKQKTAGGQVTVTGTATLWTEYGSYTEDIAPLTVSAIDIPFGNLPGGGVSAEHSSAVGADLLNTEIDVVYNVKPAGVNADYWFGY